MKVTSSTKTKILNALERKGWNKTELGEAIGRHRSWVSKLLKDDHEIEELSNELIDKINNSLGISLNPIRYKRGDVSDTALELTRLTENDKQAARLLESLTAILSRPKNHLGEVHQKDLRRIGGEVTKIVYRWEDGGDPHYGKIGAEVLTLLRKFYAKR